MKRFKIIFMGTPQFAVPCLRELSKTEHEVCLVVTQPDRPKGRGRKKVPPPVKVFALDAGYEVIQPDSVRTAEFIEKLRYLKPDILVVVAYGKILPDEVLAAPKIAPINIHASLLPKYRGSAPIQWAVVNQEKETGVTSMIITRELDTGGILLFERTTIGSKETAAELHDRLAELGASVLVKTINNIENIEPKIQNNDEASYVPMLKKSDGRINWSYSADKIDALIRGMTPWPGGYTFDGDKRYKIFSAEIAANDSKAAAGTVVLESPADELVIMTGKDALKVIEIQGESGRRMNIKDFLRGNKITAGTVLK